MTSTTQSKVLITVPKVVITVADWQGRDRLIAHMAIGSFLKDRLN